MNRKKLTRLAALLSAFSLWLLAGAGCTGEKEPSHTPSSSVAFPQGQAQLTVTIPNTGKSDCILLKWPDAAVLIDAGTSKNEEEVLALLEAQQVDKLDLLILSHMDKDHVGSADKVLESVPVERILQPDYEKGSKQEEEYLEAAQQAGVIPERLTQPVRLTLGGSELHIVPGTETAYEQSNDYSLMVTVTCGEQRFLFTGDAEKIRLNEFLGSDDAKQPYAFVKMPHHGGYEDNLPLFLAAVSPQYAAITCSEKDPADPQTLALLEEMRIETLQTVDGDIRIQTDGSSVWVAQDPSYQVSAS